MVVPGKQSAHQLAQPHSTDTVALSLPSWVTPCPRLPCGLFGCVFSTLLGTGPPHTCTHQHHSLSWPFVPYDMPHAVASHLLPIPSQHLKSA